MTESTLNAAIAKLSSEKQKDRAEALADVKAIFGRKSNNLERLNDKSYHRVFEALFRCVTIEKSIYNRSSKSNSKSVSAPRLPQCASAFRAAVEVSVPLLRTKTVHALIDHILQTITEPGDGLWDILANDYIKALRSILEYAAHVEHLSESDWISAATFCLRSIASTETDGNQLSIGTSHRSSSAALDTGTSRATPSRRSFGRDVTTSTSQVNRSVMDEAVICIQLLCTSPAVPIHNIAARLLNGLLDYLSSSATANAHQALKGVNNIIERIVCDQYSLVQDFVLEFIPIIRRLWAMKSMGVKDEVLITMMLCMDLLRSNAQSFSSQLTPETLESLVETFESEYLKRSEKELLQIDDLVFYYGESRAQCTYAFGPRLGNSRSEQNWMLLWTISSLISILDNVSNHNFRVDDDGVAPQKKPRLTSRIEDVARDSMSSTGTSKVYCLQLLAFLENSMHIEAKASLVGHLAGSIADDNPATATWALLVISNVAKNDIQKSPLLKPHWKQIWDLASRSCVSQASSRAACGLMEVLLYSELLDYSEIMDSLRLMLASMDLNGPSVFCDTSLMFLTRVFTLRLHTAVGLGLDLVKGVCHWLRSLWIAGDEGGRIQTAQVALFARPINILCLLLSLTNRPAPPKDVEFQGIAAPISSAWFRHTKKKPLKDYLFSFYDPAISQDIWHPEESFLGIDASTRNDSADNTIIELLQTKIETFSQLWKMSEANSRHVTADLIQNLVSASIVVLVFIECLPHSQSNRIEELRKYAIDLWADICRHLSDKEDTLIQACLTVVSPIIASVSCVKTFDNPISQVLSNIAHPLIGLLEHRRSSQINPAFDEADVMDLDGPALSRKDGYTEDAIFHSNRHNLAAFLEPNAFQRCLSIRLSLFCLNSANPVNSEDLGPLSLVDYLKSLNKADTVSARNLLPKVFQESENLTRTDILDIVEYFGVSCLQNYQLERCESVQCFCIYMMECFVDSWTSDEKDDLTDSASDLYGWFIQLFLDNKKASSEVLTSLSRLLEKIIFSNPAFSVTTVGPSPRTSLFNILQQGDITVKFTTADSISNIFRRFLLKDHEAIFDDVLESLPTDPDWEEGIALRLYVLSKLASRWHTLLRRGIYHTFETPGQVPQSTRYAKKCLLRVSQGLNIDDPKEIFQLFMPQILYTWTEGQSISTMPFTIFGYTNLKEMLQDAQDELVGQIMMRATDDDAAELSKCLGTSFKELLIASFHKAEAYTIARDISIPPSQDSQPKGVESRVKKLLGTESFVHSLEARFPEIVATLFKSLGQEEQIERAFVKHAKFGFAANILKRITERSASTASLPANQQPAFRARYLLDELEYLCKRAGYEMETMWTPALVSFVSRALLDSMHPALGSLHACSVLRKIRILICVSGPMIVQDYPLEQLLHALRPFLTDFHCSEDALGLFWYLLESGKPYLIQHPGFLTGIAVSTLVSLRNFLQSSPESTTQESQFKKVISKSQEFRQWLGDFLETYKPENLDEIQDQLFRRIITSSRRISDIGNSERGSYESDLLLELLQDRSSSKGLLSTSVSNLVLSLLCVDFRMPLELHNDILGDDQDASRYNVAIWQTVQNSVTDRGYRLWAARVLGRAFAETGHISDELLREQNTDEAIFYFQRHKYTDAFLASKVTILHILCEVLTDTDRVKLGLVERTLQVIITKLGSFPDFEQCENAVSPHLMKALFWSPYICPSITSSFPQQSSNTFWPHWDPQLSASQWAQSLSLALASTAQEDPIIGSLIEVLYTIPDLAMRLFQFVLHDVLLLESEHNLVCREKVSEIFKEALENFTENTIPHAQLIINAILYLRQQQKPLESTIVERDEWLDVDYGLAASAAVKCRMYKTALMFLEIQTSRSISTNRRSSVIKYTPPTDLLHQIFRKIGDPDLFYGIQQDATLESVMEKLNYESSGFKNLIFQSAQYDSDLRLKGSGSTYGIFKALNATNLHGVASALLAAPDGSGRKTTNTDNLLSTAISLQQWDIPTPPSNCSATNVLFKAFQNLNAASTMKDVLEFNSGCFLEILDHFDDKYRSVTALRDSMRALGLLTEVDDVLRSTTVSQLEGLWTKITSRKSWFQTENFQDIAHILFCRESLFSSINKRPYLRTAMKLTSRMSQLYEVKSLRETFKISRDLEGSQESLKAAISLSKQVESCAGLGLNIEGAAKFDLANVLWDQGEMTTSIRMLQQLNEQGDLHKQTLTVSRAEVLASLGHHVAEARLENPDAIVQEYLVPAVKELRGNTEGEEAGGVFHRFALFCDQQLLNQDNLEDFQRIEQLRDRKEREVLALHKMMSAAEGKEKNQLRMHYTKAKGWFDLDDRDYQRLKRSREAFLQQCLENYLLALKACDSFRNDALRFCALWLDKWKDLKANEAVSKYLHEVPSRKFAPLMNQLSSRLLDDPDLFQNLLSTLIFRICVDHPYHGMYQIFAHSKSKGSRDQAALSRNLAASKVVEKLKNDKIASGTWMSIHNNNICYVRFATDKLDDKIKSGAKVPLKKLPTGLKLEQDVNNQRLPPPSMKVELRQDRNYNDIPKVVRFQPEFAVASGISAPKIVTLLATDGLHYKQLVKGGNDDLRQDAIMEQVFEQVSNVLQDHRSTRQRNLTVRTYKVLPLTSNAGIIEFVQNTIPLHDYLMPAHQRYFPKDMKPNACRKHINDVQTRSLEHRVRTYRQVTDHFHPVMRFFFMERFNNPDDWFSRRLAYTRSTAAISILGHVLGLGDRHGHNILLDEKTGDAVHIDLGVAFEQGRVLPVPEVVPFRLTRDLVDGMGITKTEGVFRRCCEFTLEALRQESYSIMTILDVLRYDPLYMWTVSPLRMKRMQDDQEPGDDPLIISSGASGKRNSNEPSEADRALTVVAKKLSKTLSVTATVNELIQQATDERNLAVLYCGWAAYA
ncbi:putative phosphotidylinositol kinase Tel1 [Talaromyces proteolyticus]|uniref:Serine/threonine-protein kinase Tel1 n=1 Tax=Talaromyces proteolyticus TaxID=1131652 RepID=A0AAD4L0P0_9EURO|nr:putative phosphotidylinositol kinase Tel1 [Talaromyces proteolyticus]KAH8705423.1 putative phosphotidylinositol kinase Tel1 [Talaromyces proteolyticus]